MFTPAPSVTSYVGLLKATTVAATRKLSNNPPKKNHSKNCSINIPKTMPGVGKTNIRPATNFQLCNRLLRNSISNTTADSSGVTILVGLIVDISLFKVNFSTSSDITPMSVCSPLVLVIVQRSLPAVSFFTMEREYGLFCKHASC